MYVMLSGFSCQLIVSIRVRAPERSPLTEKKQILKSASIITLVTIVSRVLGYVRDQRIALLLGTTPAADAYVQNGDQTNSNFGTSQTLAVKAARTEEYRPYTRDTLDKIHRAQGQP